MRSRAKVLLPLGILLLGVVVTFALVRGRKPPQRVARPTPPPVVRVLPVELQAARLDVASQGTVTPRTETVLVAQMAGEVVEVSPALVSGGFFDAGETLLRIDPTDYRLAVKNAEAEVARAEVRLAQEEKEAELARRDWAELGSGAPDPLVLREPQLAEARAGLASARASLERARVALERTRIDAPYAGRVRDKQVDLGQYVAPGTPVATIYATDAAEIRLALPVDEIGFLDLSLAEPPGPGEGPRVRLRADFGGRTREWTGWIVRTEGEIDPRTRMLAAVARVEDPYGSPEAPLAAGLFTEATIEGRVVEGVVVLPRSALRGRDGVLVVDEEGRLRSRTVEVLRVDREQAVITGGLEEGERVCLSPIEAPVDGMEVRVQGEGIEVGVVGSAAPARKENE